MRLASLYLAAKDSAIFNGQAFGANFTADTAGIPKLDPLGGINLSVYIAANDDFAGSDVGFAFAVGTDGARVVPEVELALERAIHKQILFAGDFALDADSLRDAGSGPGRNGKRRTHGGYWSVTGSTWLGDWGARGHTQVHACWGT